MSELYEGTNVQKFLADRLASGLSQEVIRAQFAESFDAHISQLELDEFASKNAQLVAEAESRLLKRIEETSLFERAMRLVVRIEQVIDKSFENGDLKDLVALLRINKEYLALLMERQREIRAGSQAADSSNPLELFDLLVQAGAIEIKDAEKIKELLQPQGVTTFGKKKPKQKEEVAAV